jgi:hypothetical protein
VTSWSLRSSPSARAAALGRSTSSTHQATVQPDELPAQPRRQEFCHRPKTRSRQPHRIEPSARESGQGLAPDTTVGLTLLTRGEHAPTPGGVRSRVHDCIRHPLQPFASERSGDGAVVPAPVRRMPLNDRQAAAGVQTGLACVAGRDGRADPPGVARRALRHALCAADLGRDDPSLRSAHPARLMAVAFGACLEAPGMSMASRGSARRGAAGEAFCLA